MQIISSSSVCLTTLAFRHIFKCSRSSPLVRRLPTTQRVASTFHQRSFSNTAQREETSAPRQRRWADDEDERLREGIRLYGPGKWKPISQLVKTRSAHSCLSHWTRYAAPNIKKGHWSKEEDDMLMTRIEETGVGKWAAMARLIPGRTPLQCRQRWERYLHTHIRGHWSRTEDQLLSRLVETIGTDRWSHVASKMPGRTAAQCRRRWTESLSPTLTRGEWSKDEDRLVKEAVQMYGEKNWRKVSELVKTRTNVQCQQRWTRTLNPTIVKSKWTEEEDELLAEAVQEYGPKNWASIAQRLEGRTGKQCRNRWTLRKSPLIRNAPWTPEEDEQLWKIVEENGPGSWPNIAAMMGNGRTEEMCRKRWMRLCGRS